MIDSDLGWSLIFGPVPSRRLGRSLGIDLFPYKMCSFDCIYCECGPTKCLTVDQFSEPSPEIVLSRFKEFISVFPSSFDVITFSGRGEPTLYRPIGDLIEMLKKDFPSYPVAVLTNGSLLINPSVRKSILKADIVSPSLDAPEESLFKEINRPHPSIEWRNVLEGLIAFRKEYKGNYRLEVLLLKGINDTPYHLLRFSELARRIEPDIIDLTTLARPGTLSSLRELSVDELEGCVDFFPHIPCYVVGDYVKRGSGLLGKAPSERVLEDRIIRLLARRPCSLEDLADSLGIYIDDAYAAIEHIKNHYPLRSREIGGKVYYFLVSSLS
ncbi:MAG: radical SAM protein [Syntrophobacterales bacterium]|nr:radical SAM protein [Syntrophobacterales bacterium]